MTYDAIWLAVGESLGTTTVTSRVAAHSALGCFIVRTPTHCIAKPRMSINMVKVLLRHPGGNRVTDPCLKLLKVDFFSDEYWYAGCGDALIEYSDGQNVKKLLILPNAENGIYLKYVDEQGEWLSLGNSEKLDEVTVCLDDWLASTGLFLSKEDAWVAVHEFVKSGMRSSSVQWIEPAQIPADGNW